MNTCFLYSTWLWMINSVKVFFEKAMCAMKGAVSCPLSLSDWDWPCVCFWVCVCGGGVCVCLWVYIQWHYKLHMCKCMRACMCVCPCRDSTQPVSDELWAARSSEHLLVPVSLFPRHHRPLLPGYQLKSPHPSATPHPKHHPASLSAPTIP